MAVFRKRRSGSPPKMRLMFVQIRFRVMAPQLESRWIEPQLERARLADTFRDFEISPVAPEHFDALTAALDEQEWRRLALQIGGLREQSISHGLPRLGSADDVLRKLVNLATSKPAHTMELLRQSVLRTEEFTRAFAAELGFAIQGETAEESAERLERLDYSRLLAEAEAAKDSAQERMEYLKMLQEEEEREHMGRRRGKW